MEFSRTVLLDVLGLNLNMHQICTKTLTGLNLNMQLKLLLMY